MKNISIKILNAEDEPLILSILQALQENGKIEIETSDDLDLDEKTDQEILELLDQAELERGEA